MYEDKELFIMFLLLGLSTFSMRAMFLINLPQKLNNEMIRKGLESVPSALLVALVIPYTFFIDSTFDLFRLEVVVLLIAIPVIKYLKTPGLSLVFSLSLLFILEELLKII